LEILALSFWILQNHGPCWQLFAIFSSPYRCHPSCCWNVRKVHDSIGSANHNCNTCNCDSFFFANFCDVQKILNPKNPPLSFSKGGVLGNLGGEPWDLYEGALIRVRKACFFFVCFIHISCFVCAFLVFF
jgi:hypothetical protein